MEIIAFLILGFVGLLIWLISYGNQRLKEKENAHVELLNQKTLENAKRLASLAILMRQAKFVGDDETYKSVSNMKYDGALPEKLDSGLYTSPYPQLLALSIAGINYRSGIKNCIGPAKARLIADPKNEYDPNAIKVVHESGTHIGFIPADRTDDIRDLIPCYALCEIEEKEDELDHHHYFRGWLYINTQKTNSNNN